MGVLRYVWRFRARFAKQLETPMIFFCKKGVDAHLPEAHALRKARVDVGIDPYKIAAL